MSSIFRPGKFSFAVKTTLAGVSTASFRIIPPADRLQEKTG
jgi:hypothetical protein